MINPNELMRGNYLNILTPPNPVCIPIGQIMRVSEILKDSVLESNPLEHQDYKYPFQQVDPIRLTPEWLINLGFETQSVHIYTYNGLHWSISWSESNHAISLFSGEKTFDWYENEIHYVHELQNLFFALTGKELKKLKS